MEFINYSRILKYNCDFNLIFGQKSSGKTYGIIKQAIIDFFNSGEPSVYMRRYKNELTEFNMYKVFQPHDNLIKKLSHGEYDCLYYYRRRVYLANVKGDKIEKSNKIVFFTYALNTFEKENGGDIGITNYIIYDEFFTSENYLQNEDMKLITCISNIVRNRTNTKIFLLGNTVSIYNPILKLFGININNIKQGEYVRIAYKNSDTTVLVYWTAPVSATEKATAKYGIMSENARKLLNTGEFITSDCNRIFSLNEILLFKTEFTIRFEYDEYSVDCRIMSNSNGNYIVFFSDSEFSEYTKYDIEFKTIEKVFDFRDNRFSNLFACGRFLQLLKKLCDSKQDFYDSNLTFEKVKVLLKNYLLIKSL